ncbi:MAG: sugar ABC transporter ATP-binding protein [Clostridiales bacterium]|nr:sugar ABC transporter ATP-binding protein [Clostridiales bacterium]
MCGIAEQLFASLGVAIDPNAMVSELKTSEKQLLEISKALFRKARLIILDEPTTALSNEEIAHLFSILRDMKEKGTSFIFISHKMPEIFEISDRYTVLWNGKMIQSGFIAETTPSEVTKLMVGNSFYGKNTYDQREQGDTVLALQNLSGQGFCEVDLEIHKGEVFAFTGLQGSGSSELMQAIFGVIPLSGGRLIINGNEAAGGSIHRSMKEGIAMLPADRKENSVVPDMTLLENMYIAEHTLSAAQFPIHKKKEMERYATQKEALDIKAASPEFPVTSLSGGNQQKVFLARWLNTEASILLLDNPTQGIDVGAKAEIYQLIGQLAKSGKTILVNTLEIPEIQQIADRCAIFYEGKIVQILPHESIDEQTVMLYSTNAVNEEEVIQP